MVQASALPQILGQPGLLRKTFLRREERVGRKLRLLVGAFVCTNQPPPPTPPSTPALSCFCQSPRRLASLPCSSKYSILKISGLLQEKHRKFPILDLSPAAKSPREILAPWLDETGECQHGVAVVMPTCIQAHRHPCRGPPLWGTQSSIRTWQ